MPTWLRETPRPGNAATLRLGRGQDPPAAPTATPLTEGAGADATATDAVGLCLDVGTPLEATASACDNRLGGGGGGAALKLGTGTLGGAAASFADAAGCADAAAGFLPAAAGLNLGGTTGSFAGAAGATTDFLAAGLVDPLGAGRLSALLRSSLGLAPWLAGGLLSRGGEDCRGDSGRGPRDLDRVLLDLPDIAWTHLNLNFQKITNHGCSHGAGAQLIVTAWVSRKPFSTLC